MQLHGNTRTHSNNNCLSLDVQDVANYLGYGPIGNFGRFKAIRCMALNLAGQQVLSFIFAVFLVHAA